MVDLFYLLTFFFFLINTNLDIFDCLLVCFRTEFHKFCLILMRRHYFDDEYRIISYVIRVCLKNVLFSCETLFSHFKRSHLVCVLIQYVFCTLITVEKLILLLFVFKILDQFLWNLLLL